VDDTEPNDADHDRHGLCDYKRKRFDLRPDGDQLPALMGWIEEDSATLPAESDEPEC